MSKKKLLKPTNDYVFKRIFGYVGNEDITESLLSAILNEPVENVELDCRQILEQDIKTDKFGVLDIRAKINGGIQCNIEMQVVDRKNIEERLMFYWSKMYISSIKAGENYNALKKTIVILISAYNLEKLKKIEKYMSKWQIKEEDYGSVILTDLLEIYTIEMPKYEKYKGKHKLLDTWVKFIESPEVIKMSEIEENEAMKKAKKLLEQISDDEKEQYLAEQRLLYIMDQKAIEAAGYDKGLKDGMEDGIKTGQKEEKIRIAKEMLKNGADSEFIAKCTGLTKEEIEKLKDI